MAKSQQFLTGCDTVEFQAIDDAEILRMNVNPVSHKVIRFLEIFIT